MNDSRLSARTKHEAETYALRNSPKELTCHEIDPAATAWLLAATAMVLLMTPGLAIFYGGMVRTTGVLNMIMMCFISIPACTVAWLLGGLHLRVLRGRRRRTDRRPLALRHARHRPDDRTRIGARTAVRHLPTRLRDRHRRTRQRRHRRPRAGSRRGWSSSRCGPLRCTRWSRTGCGGPTAGCSTSAYWITPADLVVEIVSGRFGIGAGTGARSAHRIQEGRDAPAQPALRAARRGAAVVRLVRVQRRLGAGRQRQGGGGLPQHVGRRLPRHAGLDLRRAVP